VLSDKEKRFIKYWEEQRTGGRWSYFALYIPVGTFLCSVLTAFLFSMVSFIEVNSIVGLVIVGAVLSSTITIATWFNNERKFKSIIRREVNAGKSRDMQPSDNEVY
jgi:mannose/fructose/N-acetylgalactosamine-specific phosphotransferase system component IID